jgi:hypothetical protein
MSSNLEVDKTDNGVVNEIEVSTEKQPYKGFQKGVSGNPAGRPKGTFSLVGMLKEKLEEVSHPSRKKYAELLIDTIINKAIERKDVRMITDILNRVDGMPKQSIDLTADLETYSFKALDDATEKELKEFIQWKKDKLIK